MRSSPLQLKELFFPVISVRALLPDDMENSRNNFEVDDLNIIFNYEPNKDGHTVSAELRIATFDASKSDPKLLYSFEIEVFARYHLVSPEHKDDQANYLRQFAAASSLIGAAREQLSLITARGPWSTSYLPLITIDQIIMHPRRLSEKSAAEPVKAKKSVREKRSAATPPQSV